MGSNPFAGVKVEYHILQSFPVTCLNRDDVGAPKSAIVGGVQRARVSSQCWKRQVRLSLHEMGVKLAVRTKKVNELVNEACLAAGATEEQASACSEKIGKLLSNDTLFFFTHREAAAYAEVAKSHGFDLSGVSDKPFEKEIRSASKAALDPNLEGLDIALFGRMVAQDSSMDIQAAASFAHAISTHKVSNELEFFTALDDLEGDKGAAHMGSLEYNSATYYRYVSLDLGQLYSSLHGEDISSAVAAFTKALFLAVPAARQATQSGASTWDYARVYVRRGQRLQVSCDAPVKQRGEGFVKPSVDYINTYLDEKENMFGSLFGKISRHTIGNGTGYSIDNLVSDLATDIAGI